MIKKNRHLILAFFLAIVLTLQGIPLWGQPMNEVNAIRKDLASKPYMGWSTFSSQVYNPAVNWVSEVELKKQSDAMKAKLSQFGYEYINIDAGWNSDYGDEWGRPQIKEESFPSGFENLVDYIHNNEQKVGLYRIPGLSRNVFNGTVYAKNPSNEQYENIVYDGSEDRPILGSKEEFGREIMLSEILALDENGKPMEIDYWGYCFKIDFTKQGAQLYIDSVVEKMKGWGVDFIKFDSVSPGSFLSGSRSCIDEVMAYSKACEENDIWFEISWQVDRRNADVWKQYSNGWRIDTDVEAYEPVTSFGENARMVKWDNIARLFPRAAEWWDVAGPGGWNDFDSLLVGNGKMDGITEDERKLAATFWASSAAQFFIGDDLTQLDDYGLSLLTNKEVIAVNQAGRPVRPVDDSYEAWYANNGDGTYTVALYNLGNEKENVAINWADLGLTGKVEVRDLWAGKELGEYANGFATNLNSHAAGLYKVRVTSGTTIVNDNDNHMSYEGEWTKNSGYHQREATPEVSLNVIDSAQQDSGDLDPSVVMLDKEAAETGNDVAVTVSSKQPLVKIVNGFNALIEGTDYTVVGNQVMIAASYLKSLYAEQVKLRFIFETDETVTETETEIVNDDDAAITYYCAQSAFGYSNNRNDDYYGPLYNMNRDVHYSDHANEFALFTFNGTGVTFVTETDSPNYADYAVFIDGIREPNTFTTNDPSKGRTTQVEGFTKTGLAPGQHTIRVENITEGKYFNVDGFRVEPSPGAEKIDVNDTDAAITYSMLVNREWNNNAERHTSTAVGEYFELNFSGTGISFLTDNIDNGASYEVLIDGELQPGLYTTDNNGASESRVPTFTKTGLAYGDHTIRIANATGGPLHANAFEVTKPLGVEQPLTVYMADPSNYEIVNNTELDIKLGGLWGLSSGRGEDDYNHDINYSSEDGATITYSFIGTGIAYISEKLNEVGKFEVLVDGESQGIFDAYLDVEPSARQTKQVLYEINDLAYGRHTIKIVKKDGQIMQLDAFRVETPKQIAPSAIIYDKDAQQQVEISLEGNEDYFLSLQNGTTALTSPNDYTMSNGVISLTPAYVNRLALGEHKLKIKLDGDNGNDLHWTNNNGNAAAYTFIGTGAALIGPKGPEYGNVEVYVDNVLKDTVNANSSKRLVKQGLFSISGLSRGAHTIKIVKKSGNIMAFDALTYEAQNDSPVTAITLNKTALTLTAGMSETLTATVGPAQATNKSVTWSTANAKVATVDARTGKVSAIAAGTTLITAASVSNPEVKVSCSVTVKALPNVVTSVKVRTGLTVAKGKTVSLNAAVTPANAVNRTLTYKTSNRKIATVSSTGVVKGIKGGKVTITVTSANGKSAKCTITVAEVKLTATKAPLQVRKSTTAIKVASKYPANDKVKSYQSSNKKVATVSRTGKITAKKKGTATITVTMRSGATAKCKITVQTKKVVTKSISMLGKATVRRGRTVTLKATKNPITATEKLTWTSSNKKVATVRNGKVKGIKKGKATITVKSANGKRKTCKITVR
jgi:uncharacterized protein YjdB